jgi:putative tricarboxylic transport membrane protein
MLDLALNSLSEGIAILLNPTIMAMICIGMVWGILCGALPGLGNGIAIGTMVSLTYGMDAVMAVAFLVCISVATSFGNGLPAVVLGIPGTPSAVLTAIEGYPLTRRGEGSLAVGTNWFACIAGQLISIPFFLLLVVPLSAITWIFLSPEQFALYALGMAAIVSLAGRNVVKGLAAAALGMTIGVFGPDPVTAVYRYDLGIADLRGGFSVIPAVLGLVTISEIMKNMRQIYSWRDIQGAEGQTIRFPGFRRLSKSMRNVFTGAAIGTVLGSVPGLSGQAATVISYNQAKLTSKHPELFGKGSLEGIASNESAQNASQAGEMVPTLGLGIPGSDSMVLLMGALMLQGFVPGPQLMSAAPELLYATAAGLIGGALFILLFGWQIGRLMLLMNRLDRQVVFAGAFLITMVGVYSIRRSAFDVITALIFGIIGYFMMRYGYPVVAAAVAMVLGPGFEEKLRTGLLLERNSIVGFLTRPVTALILLLALALLIWGIRGTVREIRRTRALEEQLLKESQGGAPAAPPPIEAQP